MRLLTLRALALAATCLVQATPVMADASPVTVERLVQMRKLHVGGNGPRISPDGKKILFVVDEWEPLDASATTPRRRRSHIWIVATDGSGDARQLTFGPASELSPRWSPDGKFISFKSTRPTRNGSAMSQVWLLPADGGEAMVLTNIERGVGEYAWAPDGRRIACVVADVPLAARTSQKALDNAQIIEGDEESYSHIWVVDLDGKARRLTSGSSFTVFGTLTWSPNNNEIAFTAAPSPSPDDVRRDVLSVSVHTGAVRPLVASDDIEMAPAWSPDGKLVALWRVKAPMTGGTDGRPRWPYAHQRLTIVNPATGDIKDVYDAKFSPYDPVRLHWASNSSYLLFDCAHSVWRDVVRYDVKRDQYTKLTSDSVVFLSSVSRDSSKIAVTISSPTSPEDVYVSDESLKSVRRLTTVNPIAGTLTLGETTVAQWVSHDNMPVEGIVIRPVRYLEGRRYPTIVIVHGGPMGAYRNTFQAADAYQSAQLWANSGWLVLLPNPRGSSAYGDQFLQSNIGDWGGGDLHDILSGVDYLVGHGFADPERLAIAGTSYGGYMAAWSITQTDKFRAACTEAGIADLRALYGVSAQPNYLTGFFNGPPSGETLERYVSRSPINSATRSQTPLLILHGAVDTAVPVSQARALYRELKDAGKRVQLVVYAREGHGFAEYEHMIDSLTRKVEWISRYTLERSRESISQDDSAPVRPADEVPRGGQR